jgi:hypothetical protein
MGDTSPDLGWLEVDLASPPRYSHLLPKEILGSSHLSWGAKTYLSRIVEPTAPSAATQQRRHLL